MTKTEKRKRCAIYTRKSSEEGLEQEFNSLHAQRDACEAYIRSQAGDGWHTIRHGYDDGGISGGTMERPGLRALIADIKQGLIDIVVVYKVDRLTRSLADFAKMVEVFDAQGVSFVAVTQQFNTTTSMGRLTLNVLLSFAQFEREVTGERIRDKIAASKRKGMWMGGLAPLGYDANGRSLVINERDAETIRMIFRLYNEVDSVHRLKLELDRRGIVTRKRMSSTGRSSGGLPMSVGNLYEMLINPIYIGQIRHKGEVFPGLHPAILDQALWDETQARLQTNRIGNKQRRLSRERAGLSGKIFDEAGARLVPTHAQKQGRRYRYYTSYFLIRRDPADDRKGWRLPAAEFEALVEQEITSFLKDQAALAAVWHENGLPLSSLHHAIAFGRKAMISDIADILDRVELSASGLKLMLTIPQSGATAISVIHNRQITVRRRGQEMRIALEPESRKLDPVLLSAVSRGRKWFAQLATGESANMVQIADQNAISPGRVNQLVRLAFLSPRIMQAIIDGCQPADLTTKTFSRIAEFPIDWAEQESLLGF